MKFSAIRTGQTTALSCALAIMSVSCATDPCPVKSTAGEVIGKQKIEIKDGRLTPEILWAMGRLGEVSVSPDNQHIIYSVRYYSIAENKGNSDLYLACSDGSHVRQITKTAGYEGNITWLNNHSIAFLYAGKDGMQLFGADLQAIIDADKTDVKEDYKGQNITDMTSRFKMVQLTSIPGGMEGYKLSPDFSKIAFIRQVQVEPMVSDMYPDLDKSSGMVFHDLNYRHWDHWVLSIPHIFVADLQGADLGKTLKECTNSQPIDLLAGEPYEAPVKPFGGIEQYNWSPDGKFIAYTSRKLIGKEYATSTNTDIYVYHLESGNTHNLSQGNMGYDVNPVFSPDGRYLAWESMERDGYESDKSRLVILDLQTSEKMDASFGFDQNANGLAWSQDSKSIYFISNWHALSQIYRLDVEKAWTLARSSGKTSGKVGFLASSPEAIECLTDGIHDYTSVMPLDGTHLLGVRMSMSCPDDIFSINLEEKDTAGIHPQEQITFINKDILDQLDMGKVESRWIKTTDGKQMLTWIIYPPKFDSTKKYPALLYCQGGPQSTVSQFWSYRWNFQIMAANDYIIVAPNRRGLPGFGMEWLEQISKDYPGQNMKDYLAAIDKVSAEPYVDKDRLGCVGASYGAFSVYWLAGNHDKRFKGFVAHDGMFNLEQQYCETEEMWFVNWDLGGPYWEKQNAAAQRSFANSPHRFIDRWDAPILIIHGELDYRIVASQGMAAFNAARMRGLEAELLIYPDENHWVLQPQNGILWQRRFFSFLDKHVKGLSPEEMQKTHYAEKVYVVKNPFEQETPVAKQGGAKEVNTETQVAQ